MNLHVPWWLIGLLLGAWFGSAWTKAWAIHNREAAPVWIPWRCEMCEACKAAHASRDTDPHP